jgi:hypothetical protein
VSAQSASGRAARNPVQTDVFFIGTNRQFTTVYKTTPDGDGPWSSLFWGGPVAPAGAPIAAIGRDKSTFDNDEDLFVIGDGGVIQHTAMRSNGGWRLLEPVTIGGRSGGFALPGAPITAVADANPDRTDLFFVDGGGALVRVFRTGDGPWSRDLKAGEQLVNALTLPQYAEPGAATAAVIRDPDQLDVFLVMKGRLQSFRGLPSLLEESRKVGTDIVYLWDYWERGPHVNADDIGGPPAWAHPPYFHKGDYLPREDLGGEPALREGIAKVHEYGGKVILYVEPFIIFVDSLFARARPDAGQPEEQGHYLAGRYPNNPPLDVTSLDRFDENGQLREWRFYPLNHTMVPTLPDWQNHVIEVVQRLVNYGADGIFLDSFGWQMNWPMYVKTFNDGQQLWPLDYARGVLNLTDKVVKAIGPDRIVLVETPSGPIGHHCHGGVSADFGFPFTAPLSERITASPVRYGIPEIRYFSNGGDGDDSLNRLHQVYAAGHGLALCHQHIVESGGTHMAHIKKLVDIRRDHADALIRGQQTYQPETEDNRVAAYCYRGRGGKSILTVVKKRYLPDLSVLISNLAAIAEHFPDGYRMAHQAVITDSDLCPTRQTRINVQRDRILASLATVTPVDNETRIAVTSWLAFAQAAIRDWLDTPAISREELRDNQHPLSGRTNVSLLPSVHVVSPGGGPDRFGRLTGFD